MKRRRLVRTSEAAHEYMAGAAAAGLPPKMMRRAAISAVAESGAGRTARTKEAKDAVAISRLHRALADMPKGHERLATKQELNRRFDDYVEEFGGQGWDPEPEAPQLASTYVNTSTIPGAGMGLFAYRQFKKDEVIAPYYDDNNPFDELLTEEQLHKKYPGEKPRYVIRVSEGMYVDGAHMHASVGRFVNRPLRGVTPNARIAISRPGGRLQVSIKASRPIKKFGEVFIGYGPQYTI